MYRLGLARVERYISPGACLLILAFSSSASSLTIDDYLEGWKAAWTEARALVEDVSGIVRYEGTTYERSMGGAYVTKCGTIEFRAKDDKRYAHHRLDDYSIDRHAHLVPGGIEFQLRASERIILDDCQNTYDYGPQARGAGRPGALCIRPPKDTWSQGVFAGTFDIIAWAYTLPPGRDLADLFDEDLGELELVSEDEIIGGISSIHVRRHAKRLQEEENYWIAPSQRCALVKMTVLKHGTVVQEMTSERKNYSGIWLPWRISFHWTDVSDGETILDRKWEVTSLEVNGGLAPEVFTVESLDIASGTRVWDAVKGVSYDYQ